MRPQRYIRRRAPLARLLGCFVVRTREDVPGRMREREDEKTRAREHATGKTIDDEEQHSMRLYDRSNPTKTLTLSLNVRCSIPRVNSSVVLCLPHPIEHRISRYVVTMAKGIVEVHPGARTVVRNVVRECRPTGGGTKQGGRLLSRHTHLRIVIRVCVARAWCSYV